MNSEYQIRQIQAINKRGLYNIYAAITGGGQTFIGDFLSVSGGSNTIIGARIPYSQADFDRFVKCKINNYASNEAARALAKQAFSECIACGINYDKAMGLGVTCSLPKDNERPDRLHKVHIAIFTLAGTHVYDDQQHWDNRIAVEEQVKATILKMLLRAYGLNFSFGLDLSYDASYWPTAGYNKIFINDELVCYDMDNLDYTKPLIVYPGSWNPVHDGHKHIVQTVEKLFGTRVVLELSIGNVDKGLLDHFDVRNRVSDLTTHINPFSLPLMIDNKPTFVDKTLAIRHYKREGDLIFIVGADTWNRIWDAKYAGPIDQVKQIFLDNNVWFIVFNRPGVVQTDFGQELRIPCTLADEMNMDISSTKIRNEHA